MCRAETAVPRGCTAGKERAHAAAEPGGAELRYLGRPRAQRWGWRLPGRAGPHLTLVQWEWLAAR